MSINMVVKYDDNLSNAIRSFDDAMNALHRNYAANHETQKPWERFGYSVIYKFTRRAWIFCAKRAEACAHRHVECDGKIYDIDWKDMIFSDVAYEIEKIDYAEQQKNMA